MRGESLPLARPRKQHKRGMGTSVCCVSDYIQEQVSGQHEQAHRRNGRRAALLCVCVCGASVFSRSESMRNSTRATTTFAASMTTTTTTMTTSSRRGKRAMRALVLVLVFLLALALLLPASAASLATNNNYEDDRALAAEEAQQDVLNDDAPFLDIHESHACESTHDCLALGLQDTICRGSVCMEDKLFPLSQTEILGSIGAFVAGILSAGSGLGGGGLLVPLYILLMGLSSHEAIPLSKATIFGSAIASFIINARSKHPLARNRPLIDYETMLMMEPMTLAGTIIGVNMNAVFPEWLITVCIVWLLTKTALRTFAKGTKMWHDEAAADTKRVADIVAYWKLLPHESKFKQFQVVALAYLKWKSYKRIGVVAGAGKDSDIGAVVSNPQESELRLISSGSSSSTVDTEDDGSSDNEDESLINHGVKKRAISSAGPVRSVNELTALRNRVPFGDLTVLFLTWVGLVLFSMAKGGHGSPSIIGLACGGYVLELSDVLWIVG